MYMKHSKTFQAMMEGKVVVFSKYELWNILSYQNELGINTLMVQQSIDGDFYCCIDNISVKNYMENR